MYSVGMQETDVKGKLLATGIALLVVVGGTHQMWWPWAEAHLGGLTDAFGGKNAQLRKEAQAALDKGDNSAAIKLSTNVLDLDPKDLKARMIRGLAYAKDQSPRKAIEDLELVVASPKMDSAENRLVLARAYFDIQDYNRLIQLCGDTIKSGLLKDTAQMQTALWYQGVGYANTKQFEKAEDTLAEAVELKPANVDVYCDYALTFIVQKDYVDALDVLQQALLEIPNQKKLSALREKVSYDFFRQAYDEHRKYPGSGVPYANAAYHWIVVGKLGDALESLNKSEKLTPNNALIYRLRGELYQKQGKFKQAVADYDRALSLLNTEPTPIIWEEYVRAKRAEALKQSQ